MPRLSRWWFLSELILWAIFIYGFRKAFLSLRHIQDRIAYIPKFMAKAEFVGFQNEANWLVFTFGSTALILLFYRFRPR